MHYYLVINIILAIAVTSFFAKTKLMNSILCFLLCFSFSSIIGGTIVYLSMDKSHLEANKKKRINSNEIATTLILLLLAALSIILCFRRAMWYEFSFRGFFEDKLCIVTLLLSIGFTSLVLHMLERVEVKKIKP